MMHEAEAVASIMLHRYQLHILFLHQMSESTEYSPLQAAPKDEILDNPQGTVFSEHSTMENPSASKSNFSQ
jgi:hypothetical protein